MQITFGFAGGATTVPERSEWEGIAPFSSIERQFLNGAYYNGSMVAPAPIPRTKLYISPTSAETIVRPRLIDGSTRLPLRAACQG
jgi:hypothetical protein